MSQTRHEVNVIIEKAFVQLDKDKDGAVSKDELAVLLKTIFGRQYPEAYLDLIMQHGDRNGSGTIDSMAELLDAFTSIKAIIICCRLITVLDVDNDGYLTKDELDSKLESCEHQEVIRLIRSAPLSDNNDISCEDFFGHCLTTLLNDM